MPRRRECLKCEAAGYDRWEAVCCYCDAHLSTRHEHDHFPIPKRHGGKEVHPVCLNCHDLKDRLGPTAWTMTQYAEAVSGMPPLVKVYAASLVAVHHDLLAQRKALKEKLKASDSAINYGAESPGTGVKHA